MSTSLYWHPQAGGTVLPTNTPSATYDTLARAFGGVPCTLNADDVPVLRGIAASDAKNKAWETLLAAIHTHKEIQVTT